MPKETYESPHIGHQLGDNGPPIERQRIDQLMRENGMKRGTSGNSNAPLTACMPFRSSLERFRNSPNLGTAPGHCFIAFSSREPMSTSFENALTRRPELRHGQPEPKVGH